MTEARLHILVVEYDDELATALIGRLRADGHDVQHASDEIRARVMAHDHKPDAVILFLRREAPSLELAQYLRTNLLPSTSALVAADPGNAHAAAPYGQTFDAILHEPIDLAQVSGLLHHACWQRRR